MKIPTPMLIEELKKPIDISLWDTISPQEYRRLCKILKEAAAQLEWFLDYAVRKESKTNGQPYGMA